MRRTSAKKAALLRIYTKLRREFLEENPNCVRCQERATEVHHRAGRVGAALLDVSRWAGMCSDCHRWATGNPLLAVAEGYSLPRIGGAA